MSRTASSRSSRHSYRTSTSSTGLTTEYDYAAAYGEPALSDASDDSQIARAILDSKKSAFFEARNRSPTLSRTSSTSSWTLVGREPSSRASSISRGYIPTPRYAADEVVARSLARTWNVDSVQSNIIHNPAFSPSAGPPLVVRSSSPAPSSISTVSSSSTASTYRSPPPHGPLSPLPLSARSLSTASRSPSVRSVSSVASTRSTASNLSRSPSIASIISSVARSSRHVPLDTATRTLRASLPSPLSRSASAASIKSSRAGSVRSVSTTSSRRSASSIFDDAEKGALARLYALVTKHIPCTNPGCGALIPPAALDTISFPAMIISDVSPPRALYAALHARCPACTQNHCRGCGQPTGCAANCCAPIPSSPAASPARRLITYPTASSPRTHYDEPYPPPPCIVPTHCPAVRALGAAAALLAFDRAHNAIHQHGRTADKPLLGPLHALAFFIAPPPQPAGTPRASGSGLLMSSEGHEDGGAIPEADAGLAALVRLSRVPAYAASLLRAEADVGRWIDRAPAYGAILRVLRVLGDVPGCRTVLLRPIPVHSASGSAVEWWFRSGDVNVPTGRNGGAERQIQPQTLKGLIRRLEGARAALLRLAGALEFGPTVQQAHALCDGVLYLLLQDVLGNDEGVY
ncbi:hypothetical protein C8F01DRAFT_1153251 [Mycena amicta]|nr:hypothetical protein C8F01DRAFT_1153251 [Mycena amicta]